MSKVEEIFKDVLGYEGLYQVSNYGRVMGVKYGKVLKPRYKKTHPYVTYMLYKDKKGRNKFVHRLVWEAFNGKIPDGLTINHLDENPKNNRLDNLEVCTQSENNKYGTRIERLLKTRKKNNSYGQEREVYAIKITTNERFKFKSQMEAARQLGFYQSSISECLSGKHKVSHGYRFELA